MRKIGPAIAIVFDPLVANRWLAVCQPHDGSGSADQSAAPERFPSPKSNQRRSEMALIYEQRSVSDPALPGHSGARGIQTP